MILLHFEKIKQNKIFVVTLYPNTVIFSLTLSFHDNLALYASYQSTLKPCGGDGESLRRNILEFFSYFEAVVNARTYQLPLFER